MLKIKNKQLSTFLFKIKSHLNLFLVCTYFHNTGKLKSVTHISSCFCVWRFTIELHIKFIEQIYTLIVHILFYQHFYMYI